MALKCICFIVFIVLLLIIGAASGASKKSPAGNLENIFKNQNDRVAALYVKDGDSGDLRFLAGGANANAILDQYITQKQDLLEQFRPNAGNSNVGLGTSNTGTLGTLGQGTLGTLGTVGSTNSNGITPIVVNLGNGGTSNGNNNGLQGAVSATSPIGDLLPQIIAQAVLNQRRNQIRNGNRRRVATNRRRPNRPQIFVIRPNN